MAMNLCSWSIAEETAASVSAEGAAAAAAAAAHSQAPSRPRSDRRQARCERRTAAPWTAQVRLLSASGCSGRCCRLTRGELEGDATTSDTSNVACNPMANNSGSMMRLRTSTSPVQGSQRLQTAPRRPHWVCLTHSGVARVLYTFISEKLAPLYSGVH